NGENFFSVRLAPEERMVIAKTGRGFPPHTFSRQIIAEALVDLLVDVENRLTDLIRRPGNTREVGVGHIPAGKYFVPIPVGTEKVDRRPPGDAVASGTEVNLQTVAAEDITGPEDDVTVVEPEGEVVKLAVRAFDERDVMRLVGAKEKGGEHFSLVVAVGNDAFAHAEAEHAREEVGISFDVLGGH